MAISDIKAYAHLSSEDVEQIGRELDAIRDEVISSLGDDDARYIRSTIKLQRSLDIAGRAALMLSHKKSFWLLGTGLLASAKIIENMEIGHNVLHGQWDWMNDPEIHSTTWEWDIVGTSEHWKQTHNYLHHKYTNILGLDDDIGYGLLRVTRDQRWMPLYAFNVPLNIVLQALFEWGVGVQHLELGRVAKGKVSPEITRRKVREFGQKIMRQGFKDYVAYPAIATVNWKTTLTANITANILRNYWTNTVIFCGHFPDGAEKFTKRDVSFETRGEWYLRQMLGSANFEGGPVLHFMSGNLSHQIEHHIFPDMPSNHYRDVAVKVKAICDRYDIPYTTGPFLVQYAKTWRTIAKLSLPNKYLVNDSTDAPETHSEEMFGGNTTPTIDPVTGKRRGLRTILQQNPRPLFAKRKLQPVAV